MIVKTVGDFCQGTSISGISNVGKERESNVRRIVWFVIFCGGLAGTIYTLKSVIETLLEYPTTTSITYPHQNKVVKMCEIDTWGFLQFLIRLLLPDTFSGSDCVQSKQS